MSVSPRFGFTLLAASQAVPETAVNENDLTLEFFGGHAIFKDRDLATPPGSPAAGDGYLVAAAPTGAWTGSTCTSRSSGSQVSIRIVYTHTMITPIVSQIVNNLSMSAAATMVIN